MLMTFVNMKAKLHTIHFMIDFYYTCTLLLILTLYSMNYYKKLDNTLILQLPYIVIIHSLLHVNCIIVIEYD